MNRKSQDPLLIFQAKLRINKENLDEELAEFPNMFYTVSDHYLEAHRRVKRLQERMDRKFATLAAALRSAAHDEGIKTTETQLKQEVLIHPDYRKMKARLADAVYIQDRWAALKDAMVQKSFSIKGLVTLANDEKYQSDSRRGRGK